VSSSFIVINAKIQKQNVVKKEMKEERKLLLRHHIYSSSSEVEPGCKRKERKKEKGWERKSKGGTYMVLALG